MLERIVHRGPDDSGSFVDSHAALGSRLLAIMDIGHGRQPVTRTWNGETWTLVYNGEVYNWAELRRELEDLGMEFRTRCDTEVVAAALAAWGEGAVGRFDGQFALAAWNPRRRRLVLARDPVGIKPLYYWTDGQVLAFASEPKALFAHPSIGRQPDLTSIAEYLLHGFAFAAGYSTSGRSFYEGIESLPPGHLLTWTLDGPPSLRRFAQLPGPGISPPPSPEQAVAELRAAVQDSIRACMMGDAPLAVALSGGLDSSIVASHAASLRKAAGDDALLCVSIRYEGQANPDAEHAALLSEYLRGSCPIDLRYSRLDPEGYLDDLDQMLYHFDEPHWEPKQVAMYNNYKALKANGAKVVLTGEGADELFYGYYHRFPGFRNPRIGSAEELLRLWSGRLPFVRSLLAGPILDRLEPAMHSAVDRFYRPYAEEGCDPEQCMQRWYLHTFLHWLLLDNDRCSMAHSLEGRFPFLNRRVLELGLQIPSAWQLGTEHGMEKLVLRHAFAEELPASISHQRKKSPLPSPMLTSYHENIALRMEDAMRKAPSEIWQVLNKNSVMKLVLDYRDLVKTFARGEGLAAPLTEYLGLQDPLALRTPQVFGLLTLLRWWRMNF